MFHFHHIPLMKLISVSSCHRLILNLIRFASEAHETHDIEILYLDRTFLAFNNWKLFRGKRIPIYWIITRILVIITHITLPRWKRRRKGKIILRKCDTIQWICLNATTVKIRTVISYSIIYKDTVVSQHLGTDDNYYVDSFISLRLVSLLRIN